MTDVYGGAEMGTTMVMAYIEGDDMTIMHCGDSRCYVCDADKNIKYVTTDHNAGDYVGAPITRCFFSGKPEKAEPDVKTFKVAAGDRIFLCSDGVYPCMAPDILRDRIAEYYKSEETWKDLVARDDLDLIFITTPQYWHAEMACAAMEAGKHVACEVPLCYTLEECWRLVETSERTKKHCAMLENCCYDFFEATTGNMARQGVFGEIVFGEGAYIHHFTTAQVFAEPEPPLSKKAGMYRHAVACTVKGNRYPTHGFGPVCVAMNVGAGDRPDYLTSTETDDFVRAREFAEILKEGKDYHKQFAGKDFSGNMNLATIRTVNGKAILLKYDRMSPQPYSRSYVLSGLKGFVQKYPEPARVYLNGETLATEEETAALEKQYTPELIKYLRENALKFGGHGGMDFICEYRLIDSLRNGLPLDLTVYDGATWSAVIPLSLWSATRRSQPIDFPDFTGGNWKTNKPLDLSLRGGGSTKVKAPTETAR